MIHTQDADFTLLQGDVLDELAGLPDESVHCVVTSPPYWGLRDYGTGSWVGGNPDCDHPHPKAGDIERNLASSTLVGTGQSHANNGARDVCGKCGARRVDQQLGLEPTPEQYVARIVEVFREVRRVLRADGTCWVNLGSSYASGDTSPSPSHQPRRDPAYGSDGTTPLGSPALDSACRDLCDECLADYLSHRGRTADTPLPLQLDASPLESTGRDSGPADSGRASPGALPPDAPASTSFESWRQLRGDCSRCSSRVSALAGVRSSVSDAPASAHMPWLNYTRRLKPKDMVPTPWMVAMALQQDGWYLRADIVWSKANPMPESVTDRPTKAHEYVFLLSKGPRYFFDQEAVREPNDPRNVAHHDRYSGTEIGAPKSRAMVAAGFPMWQPSNGGVGYNPAGRNVRTVWDIATQPYPEAHFATYPEELVRRCVLAGSSERGCCPECGKPWEREVEIGESDYSRLGKHNGDDFGRDDSQPGNKGQTRTARGTVPSLKAAQRTLTGWRSTCDHDAVAIPCTVLDPFLGSGTTAYVARKHGRRSIGIELRADYCELAARRMQQQSLFA